MKQVYYDAFTSFGIQIAQNINLGGDSRTLRNFIDASVIDDRAHKNILRGTTLTEKGKILVTYLLKLNDVPSYLAFIKEWEKEHPRDAENLSKTIFDVLEGSCLLSR